MSIILSVLFPCVHFLVEKTLTFLNYTNYIGTIYIFVICYCSVSHCVDIYNSLIGIFIPHVIEVFICLSYSVPHAIPTSQHIIMIRLLWEYMEYITTLHVLPQVMMTARRTYTQFAAFCGPAASTASSKASEFMVSVNC
jgi:hypothetical protein